MKDRIIQIMQKEGLSNAEFAEKIGISTSSLSHIFNGRNKPSLDVVMRIHKACPYVNLEWLLYGEGEMEDGTTPDAAISQPAQSHESAENRPEVRFFSIFARKMHQKRLYIHLKKLYVRKLDT